MFEVDRLNGSAGFGHGDRRARAGAARASAPRRSNTILDFCFGQLRLERVWLVTDSVNERAQHMYRKAGLVEEGRLRRAFYQDGIFQDDVRMAILRDEWEALGREAELGVRRAVAHRGASSSSTTGAIRSTQSAYWAPDGWRPSSATSERSVAAPSDRS